MKFEFFENGKRNLASDGFPVNVQIGDLVAADETNDVVGQRRVEFDPDRKVRKRRRSIVGHGKGGSRPLCRLDQTGPIGFDHVVESRRFPIGSVVTSTDQRCRFHFVQQKSKQDILINSLTLF